MPDTEATDLIESGWGDLIDPMERLDDASDFYGFGTGARPYTTLDDRADGKLLPIYRNEIDLARIRASSRNLASIDGVAIGAVDSLANYIFGKNGLQFAAQADDPEAPEGLADAVQNRIDRFLDANEFHGELDREIHQRSREDGESLLQLEKTPKGIMAELLEPDQLTQPAASHSLHEWILDQFQIDCDAFVPSWSFGVLTPANRCNRVLGYHIVRDGTGNDWDFLPSGRVEHFKRNTPQSAKRGVSDLYPVLEDMRNESKLSRNIVLGAALQAAIAWIEEFPTGTTQAQVTDMTSLCAETTVNRPRASGSSASVSKTRVNAGTIVRTSPGRSYKPGPMGAERNSGFLAVAQYIMRRIGVRWTIPESLISADASNANMASSLIAEGPFVKAREADQQWYGRRFVNMLWKVLRMDFESGYFDKFGLDWNQFETFVDIVVEYPSVATRDKEQQARVHETYVRMGVLSKATAATEAGYNLKEEVEKGATSQEDAAAKAQQTKDEREYDLARQSLELQAQAAPVPSPVADAAPVAPPVDATIPAPVQAGVDVASAALNGAQIASLLAIVGQLTAGTLPQESARATIKAAFPTMPDEQIDGILGPLVGFTPPGQALKSAVQEGYDEGQHPRDDQGQWVDSGSMMSAAIESVRTTAESRAILESLRGR